MTTHRYADAIESKLAAARAVGDEVPGDFFGSEAAHSVGGQARDAFKGFLPRCESFFCSAEISGAIASSSRSLPSDTTVDFRETTPQGWMWFERPLELHFMPDLRPVRAIAWSKTLRRPDAPRDEPNSVLVGSFCDIEPGNLSTYLGGFSWVAEQNTLGDVESGNGHAQSIINFWTALTLWLEQRVVVSERDRPDRACRRRLERAGINSQAINVIRLRRAENSSHHGSGEPREWSCQWIVRGHWRQQYYPKTDQRRPLWIMPHVKGPEDAPLKTPAPTVFAVTR